jgi:microsomal dipeptidase-like Zn-dependent dipeptidase
MHRLLFAAVLLVSTVALASPAKAQELTVDLHAHLFMDEALGWFFEGNFNDAKLSANSWDDRLSSKANRATLQQSGLGVVVVSLIAHPVYRADMRDAVRKQIAAAERFVAETDGWAIARNAGEVKAIVASGRRAMVLSLEGAVGVLESEDDLREFIDEKGISIVTEIHLVDDRFGGAAALTGFQYAANPRGVADQLLDAHFDGHGVQTNRHGLSPLGKTLAIELIKRGVWIDLTHASDAALAELVPIVEQAGQPLLFTHTTLRRYRPAERSLSDAMLARVAKSGGIIGLIPTEDAFQQISPSKYCPKGCSAEQCSGSVHAFATMFEVVAAAVGADAVMLGSDHNGGMRHLRPACGTGTDLDADPGLYNIAQTKTLWQVLRQLGAPVPAPGAQLARFIEAWGAVTPRDISGQVDPEGTLPPLPARKDVEGPSLAARIGVGVSGGNTGGEAALLAQIDLSVRKDMASERAVEPIFYLVHLNADVSLVPGRHNILPYGELRFAPVGVRLNDLDNLLEGEALRARLRRHDALDQAAALQVALFGGVARVMPGILKARGGHNLFLQLEADLLGYKYLHHVDRQRSDLHAFYAGGAALLFGASVHPVQSLRLSIYSGLGSDISVVTSTASVGYQSDIAARAGSSLGTTDRRFVQFFEARWLASRESKDDLFHATPHYRGGVSVAF